MKRKYYMADENALPPGRWFLGDFRSTDFQDRRRLDLGEPCRGVFTVDPGQRGRALDFSLTAFGLPIATIALAEIISKLADRNVHLVPVNIKGYGEYRFVQCLREIDCVDEPRSDFETFGSDAPTPSMRGDYRSFMKLVVDQSRISKDAHMFFLAKWRVRPIISEVVRNALVQTKSLGVSLIDVTE